MGSRGESDDGVGVKRSGTRDIEFRVSEGDGFCWKMVQGMARAEMIDLQMMGEGFEERGNLRRGGVGKGRKESKAMQNQRRVPQYLNSAQRTSELLSSVLPLLAELSCSSVLLLGETKLR